MITLRKLAWQYIDEMTGGRQSQDSTLDDRMVALEIRAILNELIKPEYYTKYAQGDRSAITQCIATYKNIPIKKDEDLDAFYSDLPEFYIALPYNKGVHSVIMADRRNQVPIPLVRRNTPGVSYNTDVFQMIRKKSYYVEGLKVYYDSRDIDTKKNKAIIKLIVAAPDSIGLDDPLPILPEHQAEVLRRLRQKVKAPIDIINDNIDAASTTPDA